MELEMKLTVLERTELEKNEEIIEYGLQTFFDVGVALREIRDNKLYREARLKKYQILIEVEHLKMGLRRNHNE